MRPAFAERCALDRGVGRIVDRSATDVHHSDVGQDARAGGRAFGPKRQIDVFEVGRVIARVEAAEAAMERSVHRPAGGAGVVDELTARRYDRGDAAAVDASSELVVTAAVGS